MTRYAVTQYDTGTLLVTLPWSTFQLLSNTFE